MSHSAPAKELLFSDLGLAPKMLAILERLKFTVPTPIQRQAIPIAVTGKDVIGIAQTGTGKTLAFALPMLQQIARTKKQGLIIVPTRELALQVDEVLQQVGHAIGLRRAVIIGGAAMAKQVHDLRRQPHVIVGTPGRMIDHLEQGTLRLHGVGIIVLDEADRMLDMGFAPQIKRVLQTVPRQRQTMLFSATMPPEIVTIAAQYMHLPVRVEVAPAGTIATRVNQELFIVPKDQKNRLLDKLLGEYTGTVLIFSRTKHGAKRICQAIKAMGHSASEIHSNLSLSQRRKALAGFKDGTHRILVATDIAARGIDVTNIELVLNYDLPDSPDDYVHRVGRTGRAGQAGEAITFITPDQRSKIHLIERLVRASLRISPLPTLPIDRTSASHQGRQARRPFKAHQHRNRRGRKNARVHF
jgi:ATP-dependent RNA helicase RhlE